MQRIILKRAIPLRREIERAAEAERSASRKADGLHKYELEAKIVALTEHLIELQKQRA